MKIKSFITTYNRLGMLSQVVNHLNTFGIIPQIKDDGSTYNHNFHQYFRHEHRGKDGFYLTWQEMLLDCEKSDAELFLFMPDDFQDLDYKMLLALHYEYTKHGAYAFNIINDGRSGMWTGIQESQLNNTVIMCGMVDCGFFCNKQALDGLNVKWYEPTEVDSGVGKSLSLAFLNKRVPMYKPAKSLAVHGNHKSEMHTEERIKNPLISR